jgi:hypothetical protein
MPEKMEELKYDVVVVGAGAAGVAAAIAAKKNGAEPILIEAGPFLGGELVSGLPIDGCLNARGDWIIGGVGREIFDLSKSMGGFVEPIFDWRLMYGVCLDPEMLKLAIIHAVNSYKIKTLMYSFVDGVVMKDNRVRGVLVVNKKGRTLITGDYFVDATGDGDVAVMAGAEYEKGSANKEYQPVSLVFWMSGIDYGKYLEFIRDNPNEFILAESPVITKDKAGCAMELYKSGHPFAMLDGKGNILRKAAESGEMFPTWSISMWPTCPARKEIGLNTTRVADLDATDPDALSAALATLAGQIELAHVFLKKRVPGFQDAVLAGIAPRIGIRETRRIMGEYVLTAEDVLEGRKFESGIAKGAHHIDVHGSGTVQKRQPVKDGMSYDIPYGCIIPRKIENLFITGRSISSTREALGSARVMAQCMATGEAAATAAALCVKKGLRSTRDLDVAELRKQLKAQKAVVDGTS